jgi:hypothetical protein
MLLVKGASTISTTHVRQNWPHCCDDWGYFQALPTLGIFCVDFASSVSMPLARMLPRVMTARADSIAGMSRRYEGIGNWLRRRVTGHTLLRTLGNVIVRSYGKNCNASSCHDNHRQNAGPHW